MKAMWLEMNKWEVCVKRSLLGYDNETVPVGYRIMFMFQSFVYYVISDMFRLVLGHHQGNHSCIHYNMGDGCSIYACMAH